MGDTLPARGERAPAKQAERWIKVSREADRVEELLQDAPRERTRQQAPPISIAAGCSFEGLLSFSGETQVDGELVGEVVAQGTLRLGRTARVRARIEVDELIVAGELVGDVIARRRIELLPSSRVRGSIETPRLSLAEGCVFQGRCRCLS